MEFEAWGIRSGFYLDSSFTAAAWLLLIVYALVLLSILWPARRRVLIFGVVYFPLALLGSQVALLHVDIFPGFGGVVIPLFGGLLILLPGAWLGTGPALLSGLAFGLGQAGWGEHNPFLLPEMALLGALAAYFLQQRYQGRLMSALRQPILAGVVGAVLVWPLHLPGLLLRHAEPFALASVEGALAQMGPVLVALVGQMVVGGLVLTLARRLFPALASGAGERPPPWATSLGQRLFFYRLGITVLNTALIIAAIVLVSWRVAAGPEQAVLLAAPLISLAVGVAALGLVLTYWLTGYIARPIQQLTEAANRIAEGGLSHPVFSNQQDEVGRLGASLDRMRQSLKQRLDEQAVLLQITQETAVALTSETLPYILKSCLDVTGAETVRVVLAGAAEPPVVYAAGRASDALDRRLLDVVESSGELVIPYTSRAQAVVDISVLEDPPGALVALPLRQDLVYWGVLWLGYGEAREFSASDLSFLHTLRGHVASVVARAERYEKAQASRDRFENILDSIGDAVLAADRDGSFVFANAASENFLNVTPQAAFGQSVRQVVAVPALVELLSRPLPPNDAPYSEEVMDAEQNAYAATVSPLVDADGAGAGQVVVLHDITELKEIDAMKDDFVQIVSHDLRSPLTYMRGYATMLGMVGPLNEKQEGFANKIVVGIEQMSSLIENVLDIGRLESGGDLEREPCDVAEMIEDIIAAQNASAVTKQITLIAETDPDMPIIMADEHMLRQAIANLVDNAIKYTPQEGSVQIHAHMDETRLSPDGFPSVVVSVADDGPGISQADQIHIFKKFFRVRKKENIGVKGSGLGLTIVKGVAQRHGGDAWVESELGEGTTFFIALEAVPPGARRKSAD